MCVWGGGGGVAAVFMGWGGGVAAVFMGWGGGGTN